MKTKKLLFGFGLLFSAVFAHAQNGLDSIIVEKYYISNAADAAGSLGTLPVGSVTYRIYAAMQPGYKFEALFGVPNHELKLSTTTSFFNNEDRGATTPNGITVNYSKNNTVLLDSWFSVGATATGEVGVLKTEDTNGFIGNTNSILQNNDPAAGIPITTQDGMIPGTPELVQFVGFTTELNVFDATSQQGNLFSTTNGSIASMNGSVGPTSNNRVLLGQFTTDGQFCYKLNVQIGTPAGGYQQFVAENPTGSYIQLPSLMGCIVGGSTVAINENASSASSSFTTYPNPAQDMVTIEINAASKQSSNNSYSIYTVEGTEVLQKQLGTISQNQVEHIDVSSLSKGLYFIKVTIDGVVSTKKIIKN